LQTVSAPSSSSSLDVSVGASYTSSCAMFLGLDMGSGLLSETDRLREEGKVNVAKYEGFYWEDEA